MRFELVKKVPIVEIGGKRCSLDTGFPGAFMPVCAGVQEFFGIPGLQVAGVKALKRYTKFDYRNSEITTSDELISLERSTTSQQQTNQRNVKYDTSKSTSRKSLR